MAESPEVEVESNKKKVRSRKFLSNFIIYPNHRAKAYWDLFITMILLMTCIVTPFDIAFQRSGTMMNTITDLMFGMDIVIIMNSAFYDGEMNLIDNRKDIAINYFKGWFAVDLLAIIPFDVILTNL
jgi:potassium voltage-gated channel Eag-related subfamily H member 8